MLEFEATAQELVQHSSSLLSIVLRLLIATVFGLLVSAVYWLSQRRDAKEKFSLSVTIVLLTTLVAMTTMVIGDSLARAFGLVGALSIVRFRTVVEDTRDTAFVIFAVVVGMAIGAGNVIIALIGVPIVAVTAISLGMLGTTIRPAGRVYELELRIGTGHDLEQAVQAVLDRFALQSKVISVVTARQGVALDLQYQVQLKPAALLLELVKALNQIEGVQSIEVREPK